MKTLIVNGNFDYNLLVKFVDSIEKLENGEILEIFLDSNGGSRDIFEYMLYTINSNPERFKIVTGYKIYSAAFNLLMFAKCEKYICKSTRGMTHLSLREVTLNSNKTATYQ